MTTLLTNPGDMAGPVTLTRHLDLRPTGLPYEHQWVTRFVFTAPNLPDPVTLAHLGELALALHCSDDPLTSDLDHDRVAALIVAGVLAVGVDRIRTMDVAVRAANGDYMEGRITRRQWRDRCRPVWSAARETRCTGLVWDLDSRVSGGVA